MTQTVKTNPRKPWILLSLVLVLVLAACASTGRDEKKTLQSLRDTVDAFNSSFKWEDYPAAAAFVPKDKKEQFWIEVDKFKGKIRLADFEIREVTHEEKNDWAVAIVYFQYWRTSLPTVQTVTFSQKWHWNEKEKIWRVDDSGFGAITKVKTGF